MLVGVRAHDVILFAEFPEHQKIGAGFGPHLQALWSDFGATDYTEVYCSVLSPNLAKLIFYI